MLYYKIYRDKNFNNFISIDETELEKALAAFRFETSAIFKNGALEKIGDILPDYNKTMGWNPSYNLGDDDWNDIRNKGVDRALRDFHQTAKEKIDYLVNTNQQHLIGKNVELDRLKKIKSGGSVADGLKNVWDRLGGKQ